MQTGPFDDPLKGWPNDDLLLEAKARTKLAAAHPEAYRVLDWPDLREAFETHDLAANAAKRRNRMQGVSGLSISGLGVMILAIAPLASPQDVRSVTILALILMSIGGLVGLSHWIILRSRRTWLGHRYWTERLRQLHFQSIANNLDLVSLAMVDDDALDTLKRKRVTWLADMAHDTVAPGHLIRGVVDDFTDRLLWLRSDFEQTNLPKAGTAQLAPLFTALERLRIGVQYEYAQRNLGSDIYSAPLRAKALRFLADGSFVATIVAAIIAWVTLASGTTFVDLSPLEWTGVAGLISAAGLTCKSLLEGTQVEADVDRYRTYAESVDEVRTHFLKTGTKTKVEALRRLELLSYREMRHFLRTHHAARFFG